MQSLSVCLSVPVLFRMTSANPLSEGEEQDENKIVPLTNAPCANIMLTT